MSRWRAVPGTVGFFVLLLASLTPAGSTTLLPENLAGLVDGADRIFLGRVISEWTGRDEHDLPATITTFKIMEVLKGNLPEELPVKQLGVTEVQPDGLATWVDGMPRYRLGFDYLIFLPADSSLGFTSPVGLFQGAFTILQDSSGIVVATNGINNANLFLGVGSEELIQLGLTPETFPFTLQGRGPVPLTEILGMVQQVRPVQREDSP